MRIDGEITEEVPEQIEYESIEVDCGEEATGVWDEEIWGLTVTNINKTKIKCAINFIRKDYKEEILNGADPVLAENLIPVVIEDDGVVRKANIKEEWYSYTNKEWANAVILEDETKTYNNGEVIPESNIESYFVWIPRYRYKIWDEGNYSSLTTIDTEKVHTIQVEFESKEIEASTGSTINSWLTHPAFTSFGVNGLWVGKFESGYKGAMNASGAQSNTNSPEKLQIKPNIYSWRSISISNAHLTSYNYQRELDSHMMKNTEWGSVAYLQHSMYGNHTKVQMNNNESYKTGYASLSESETDTFMYNTNTGYLASTTGNISGIYDMSGGAREYVMGVMLDASENPYSGRNNLFSSGFVGKYGCPSCDNADSSITENTDGVEWPDVKYYDLYTYGIDGNNYSRRILGDATGEMGPFNSNYGSWYNSGSIFLNTANPWFERGHGYSDRIYSSIFSFSANAGLLGGAYTFRIVLAI